MNTIPDHPRGDPSFAHDAIGLGLALALLRDPPREGLDLDGLSAALPEQGVCEHRLLGDLARLVIGGANPLDTPVSFAHMDPPTPWLTWAMALWDARLNQNLLHPATAPAARAIEQRTMAWLAPFFGMDGGHMVPGSTVANLTGLWAARELRGVTQVAAPETAHVSIEKSARLLGLAYRRLPTDRTGRLLADGVTELENACLVLVAGATSTGVVDPLDLAGRAAWTHVDAAWAGPLRLSERHFGLLAGIENADSIAVSAHKWLFQPKESAFVLFRDADAAHAALSFGGDYLAAPNVGILGSRGAAAVPLFATLMAWGRLGVAERLDRCIAMAERFAGFVANDHRLELLCPPETGVVCWRPVAGGIDALAGRLVPGLASRTSVAGQPWLRCVAANPVADVERIISEVSAAV